MGTWGFAAFVTGVLGMLTIRSNAAVPHVDLYPLGAPVFEVGLNALALGAWKTYRLRGRVPSLLAPVGHGGGRQRHVVRNALVIDALRSVLWDRYNWSRIELATGYPYPDCSLVMAAHQAGLRVVVDGGLPDKCRGGRRGVANPSRTPLS